MGGTLPPSGVCVSNTDSPRSSTMHSSSSWASIARSARRIWTRRVMRHSGGASGSLKMTRVGAPVLVSIAMLALNLALNTLFLVGLGLDVEGLALGTALSSWGNLALLLPGLLRRLPQGALVGGAGVIGRIGGAAGVCGLAAAGGHAALGGEASSASALAGAIACGVVGYVVMAEVLRIPQWRALRARLGRPGGPPGPAR